MEEALKQEAAALGVAEKIVFHGFLKPQEVRSLMKRCQLHVFTSNYLEGWGHASVRHSGRRSSVYQP